MKSLCCYKRFDQVHPHDPENSESEKNFTQQPPTPGTISLRSESPTSPMEDLSSPPLQIPFDGIAIIHPENPPIIMMVMVV